MFLFTQETFAAITAVVETTLNEMVKSVVVEVENAAVAADVEITIDHLKTEIMSKRETRFFKNLPGYYLDLEKIDRFFLQVERVFDGNKTLAELLCPAFLTLPPNASYSLSYDEAAVAFKKSMHNARVIIVVSYS